MNDLLFLSAGSEDIYRVTVSSLSPEDQALSLASRNTAAAESDK
jgi:hypothetical protein